MVLSGAFYLQEDVVLVARQLLGKVLVTNIGGLYTSGIITETEAYAGIGDRASHAWNGRRTARTEAMYAHGGIAYVFLCYGMHHLFNVVTNEADTPHAVLIRAVEPLDGRETMLSRRKKKVVSSSLTAGPGVLSRALGIDKTHTGTALTGDQIWIEDRGITVDECNIVAATRVGVAYANEDALLPYRFYIRDSSYVSKARGL